MIEVLDEFEPGHGITSEAIRPHLRAGFPWHQPDRPHPELSDPKVWWTKVGSILATGLQSEGMSYERSEEITRLFRLRYMDGSVAWKLSPDVGSVLSQLTDDGWRNVILSNHVPELAAIVEGVGLGGLVDQVISSANVGYEKPHPAIFALARELSGDPQEIWMVGDNPQADIDGARAVGIPAILEQHPDRPVTPGALSLMQAVEVVRKSC
ncbi:phosphoglycolate phosphatase [mine drainage metagenome]|uniref:Phosphoglycolate phosphatase n=1 Tax=mine drainage metagenome TaxID=410659 RepID=A0A1J5PTU2_9ZZZZ